MVERNFHRRRFSLQTLILLVPLAAILIVWFQTKSELKKATDQAQSMRSLTRYLEIKDENQYGIISRIPRHPFDIGYSVFVPKSTEVHESFQLNLALENIGREPTVPNELPEPTAAVPIASGRHKIEIKHSNERRTRMSEMNLFEILVDDEVVISTTRPDSWGPQREAMSTHSWFTEASYQDTSRPAVIHRLRFVTGGNKNAEGILVWIDKATLPDP